MAWAFETSSNKAIPPISSQTAPPPTGQAFKYESMWVHSHLNHYSIKHKSIDPSWLLPSDFQVRLVGDGM